MTRRAFTRSLFAAAFGAAILPPALTYQRRWVKQSDVWVIDWNAAPVSIHPAIFARYLQLRGINAQLALQS